MSRIPKPMTISAAAATICLISMPKLKAIETVPTEPVPAAVEETAAPEEPVKPEAAPDPASETAAATAAQETETPATEPSQASEVTEPEATKTPALPSVSEAETQPASEPEVKTESTVSTTAATPTRPAEAAKPQETKPAPAPKRSVPVETKSTKPEAPAPKAEPKPSQPAPKASQPMPSVSAVVSKPAQQPAAKSSDAGAAAPKTAAPAITVKKPVNTPGIAVYRTGPKASYKTGDSVDLAARAEGGKGDLRYQFYVIRSNGRRTDLTRLRYVNTFTWVPENPDKGYKVGVDIVDQTGRKLTRLKPVFIYRPTVKPTPTPPAPTPEPEQPLTLAVFRTGPRSVYKVDDTVALAARAEGGKGALRYLFFTFTNDTLTGSRINLTQATTNNVFNWLLKADSASTRVGVEVTDQAGRKLMNEKTIKVNKNPTVQYHHDVRYEIMSQDDLADVYAGIQSELDENGWTTPQRDNRFVDEFNENLIARVKKMKRDHLCDHGGQTPYVFGAEALSLSFKTIAQTGIDLVQHSFDENMPYYNLVAVKRTWNGYAYQYNSDGSIKSKEPTVLVNYTLMLSSYREEPGVYSQLKAGWEYDVIYGIHQNDTSPWVYLNPNDRYPTFDEANAGFIKRLTLPEP